MPENLPVIDYETSKNMMDLDIDCPLIGTDIGNAVRYSGLRPV